jgi:myo-inositol 2-dehydrogenase/D-chiro-inositol 1-dehydrogenase
VNVGRGIGEGSADMVTAGDTRRTSMTFHRAEVVVHDTIRRNSDLFHDAYTSELDARSALEIALGAIESVKSGRPVRPEEVEK